MRSIYLASAIVLSLLVATGCKGKKQEAAQVEKKVAVKTTTARVADVAQVVEFTANIEPFKKNHISASMPVRIDDINVEVGNRVAKGQLLVKMDETQYRQAAVQYANIKTDYERMKAVYDAGGVSKQQLDQIATQVEVAKQALNNLKQNIELRSPIDGVVTGRYYDAGDMFSMSPNASGSVGVLTVMQINKLKASVNVSEQYFLQVTKGMPVEIVLDILPDQNFKGSVSLIYPAIDPQTRTFTVEITIPNGDNKLRPGMFARATLNFGKKPGVLIADMAVQKQVGSNEKYVYVVENGVAKRVNVIVGRRVGKEFEILSGLSGDEQIVIAGASKLSDGEKIEVAQ